MFDNFKTAFLIDTGTLHIEEIESSTSIIEDNVRELLFHHGGKSYNKGIYRIVPIDKVYYWNKLILHAFPMFSGRITCFAVDWLGRVFATDSARIVDGHSGILMFEPGTAEALEIPCNIETFHECELILYQEEALAKSFYHKWLEYAGLSPAINQCIGYKIPLFLGGSDTVENLDVSDLDVYWTISANLIQKMRSLSPGTLIANLRID